MAFLVVTPEVLCLPKGEKEKAINNLTDWKYTWPAFLWNLLSGHDVLDGVPFYDVYEPSSLWRFVPLSLRPFWIDDV